MKHFFFMLIIGLVGCKQGKSGAAIADETSGFLQITQTCTQLQPTVLGCGYCEIWAKANVAGDKVIFWSGDSGGVILDAQADCLADAPNYGEIAEGEVAIYWYTLTPVVETKYTMVKNAYSLDDPKNIWVYFEQGDF